MMRKSVYARKGRCLTIFTFVLVVGLFLISHLLLSQAPILDITDARRGGQCENEHGSDGEHKPSIQPQLRSSDSDHRINIDTVSCPNAGIVSGVTLESYDATGSESWVTFAKALREYKKFHEEKLNQLKVGGLPTSVRTLTWACSQSKCTGLGDQLLRLQFFFLLAVMSDRVFTVYWDEGLKQSSKYLIPNEIDWNYFDKSKGMCTDDKLVFSGHNCAETTFDATSIWGFSWNTDEFSRFGEVLFGHEQHITVTGWVKVNTMYIGNESILHPGEKIREGFERLGLKDILASKPQNTVHCGHKHFWYNLLHKIGVHKFMEIPESSSGKILVSEQWIQMSHVIFCYLFKFPQTLITEVDRVMRTLGLEHKRYFSVHLRTGFKGTPYEESIATRWLHKNWKMFYDEYVWDGIMNYTVNLAVQRLGPNAPIYLSTDTDLAKQRFLKKFRGHIRIFNSTVTHSAFVRNKCKDERARTEDDISPNDVYMSMWVDFFILARSYIVVHGESSFSVAACLVEPVPHVNQVWYMQDHSRNCIASYIGSNTTCILVA